MSWYQISLVNQHDINIIKQQFTCLLHTIGKYLELSSFIALLLHLPSGTRIKYYYPKYSVLSLSLPLVQCFSIEIQTYIQNVGEEGTHTRIQTYIQSNALIIREEEKEPNIYVFIYIQDVLMVKVITNRILHSISPDSNFALSMKFQEIPRNRWQRR